MKLALIFPLVVACAASQPTQHQVHSSEGSLFWEYESSDGIPDGESKTYYPNGELRSTGSFRNAEFHGAFVRYREDGEVAFKAFFWHDVLVWKSRSGEPPVALLAQLQTVHDPIEVRRRFGNPLRRISNYDWLYIHDRRSPLPRFVYADWRTSDRPVVGARLRVGGVTAPGTVAVSESIFGQIPMGAYAASVLFTQSQLHFDGARIWGRSVLDLGGNRRWETEFGQLVAHTSLSFPVAGEDATSALATAATVLQSPEMAVTSVGSTAALRASGSWLWHDEKWGVQTDLGADRTVGGDQTPSLTFIHAAVAVAYGVRSIYATLELSSVGRLGGASDKEMVTSAGIGGAFRALGFETKVLLGSSVDFDITATLGAEYEF